MTEARYHFFVILASIVGLKQSGWSLGQINQIYVAQEKLTCEAHFDEENLVALIVGFFLFLAAE